MQKGSVVNVWLVLATPLKWELIIYFSFLWICSRIPQTLWQMEFKFLKLNSHNMVDIFRKELMIVMLLLRDSFAWSSLKGKRKVTKKPKKRKQLFCVKNTLIIQARIIRITSNINIYRILEYLKCFSPCRKIKTKTLRALTLKTC